MLKLRSSERFLEGFYLFKKCYFRIKQEQYMIWGIFSRNELFKF